MVTLVRGETVARMIRLYLACVHWTENDATDQTIGLVAGINLGAMSRLILECRHIAVIGPFVAVVGDGLAT